VRKAVVTLIWLGTPRAWATMRTDGSGRFAFEELPAGKYDLRADKAGLGTANYGADSVRELGDTITLRDAETRVNLKLRFLRAGTISGRVVDADGEPVSGIPVHLLRSGRNLAERVLLSYLKTYTNDRGEYKITGVDPGEYYLRCMLSNFGHKTGAGPHELMMPQYFGGTRDSKDAAAVNLRGADITGIDFHLTAEPPATISGRVQGLPALDTQDSGVLPDVRGGDRRCGFSSVLAMITRQCFREARLLRLRTTILRRLTICRGAIGFRPPSERGTRRTTRRR
jgi:hypothetical protein